VGVLVQLRAALDFGKTSWTRRRTTRFRSRAQVGSRWTMATVAVDGVLRKTLSRTGNYGEWRRLGEEEDAARVRSALVYTGGEEGRWRASVRGEENLWRWRLSYSEEEDVQGNFLHDGKLGCCGPLGFDGLVSLGGLLA
jgi:hypothetical protein